MSATTNVPAKAAEHVARRPPPVNDVEELLKTLTPLAVLLRKAGVVICSYLVEEFESITRLSHTLSPLAAVPKATPSMGGQRVTRLLPSPQPQAVVPFGPFWEKEWMWQLRAAEARTAGTGGSVVKGMPSSSGERVTYFSILFQELFQRLKLLAAPFEAVRGGSLTIHYADLSTFVGDLQLFFQVQRLQETWMHLKLCRERAGVVVAPHLTTQVEEAFNIFYVWCPNYTTQGRVALPTPNKPDAAAMVKLREFPFQFSIGLSFLVRDAPLSCYFHLRQREQSATMTLDRPPPELCNRAFPEYEAMAPFLARFCIDIMLELNLVILDVTCDPLLEGAAAAPEAHLVRALARAGFCPYIRYSTREPQATLEMMQLWDTTGEEPDIFRVPTEGRIYGEEWRFWRLDLRLNPMTRAARHLRETQPRILQPGALQAFRPQHRKPEDMAPVAGFMLSAATAKKS